MATQVQRTHCHAPETQDAAFTKRTRLAGWCSRNLMAAAAFWASGRRGTSRVVDPHADDLLAVVPDASAERLDALDGGLHRRRFRRWRFWHGGFRRGCIRHRRLLRLDGRCAWWNRRIHRRRTAVAAADGPNGQKHQNESSASGLRVGPRVSIPRGTRGGRPGRPLRCSRSGRRWGHIQGSASGRATPGCPGDTTR